MLVKLTCWAYWLEKVDEAIAAANKHHEKQDALYMQRLERWSAKPLWQKGTCFGPLHPKYYDMNYPCDYWNPELRRLYLMRRALVSDNKLSVTFDEKEFRILTQLAILKEI